ncbi:HIRAN domain-containing protein [Paenibacillus koleovorans]|uniref:HIRAN domain-containing protein n=1 Tax=Paenibacillus koleovorans TaxID=121608 RepID=UPI000FDA5A93|nr:HIRAN domain-containing protein [Paenibacillus koleovorans]
MEYNKLLLSWKGPNTKINYLVGVLEKHEEIYCFYYNLTEVEKANDEGFKPFIGLSDVNKVYRSEKLFSVFERRLPHQSRAIFKKFIEDHGQNKSNDHNWDYLSLTKGRLATDSVSFLNPIVFKNGQLLFSFEVAGWSYTKTINRLLEVEDVLNIGIDLNNPWDQYALELTDPKNNNVRVGYMPRPFNEVCYKFILNDLKLEAMIVGIIGEEARPIAFVFSDKFHDHDVDIPEEYKYLIEFQ